MTCSTPDKFENIRIQLIENIHCDIISNLEAKLWQREKYWQAQLFTVSMNCDWDWYSTNRKGYRK